MKNSIFKLMIVSMTILLTLRVSAQEQLPVLHHQLAMEDKTTQVLFNQDEEDIIIQTICDYFPRCNSGPPKFN